MLLGSEMSDGGHPYNSQKVSQEVIEAKGKAPQLNLTLGLLPPCSETLQIASIPHIVALEVQLPHGW